MFITAVGRLQITPAGMTDCRERSRGNLYRDGMPSVRELLWAMYLREIQLPGVRRHVLEKTRFKSFKLFAYSAVRFVPEVSR